MINWNLKKVFSPLFEKDPNSTALKNDTPIQVRRLISDEPEQFDTKSSKVRIIIFVLIFAVSVFIQEAFFNDLRIMSVKPEFMIVVIYIFGFLSNLRAGMFFGLSMGLYIDIVYGRFFGLYGILLMYAAIIASLISMIPGEKKPNHKGSIGFMYLFAPFCFVLYTVCESFVAKLMLMYSNMSNTFYEDYKVHFIERILPVSAYSFIIFAVMVWPLVAIWKAIGKKSGL